MNFNTFNDLNKNIPKHLDAEFYIYKTRKIKLSKLKIKVTNKESRKISNYLQIEKTPHFSFVENYLFGKEEKVCLGYKNYEEYNEYNQHHLNVDNFKILINNIITNGFEEKNSKIICLRNFYNPINKSFKVLDGSHRLAIISVLNFKNVNVAIANYKVNILKRKLESLKNKTL